LLVDLIVFDGVDELDVIGPLEVFRRAAAVGAEVAVRICSREHVEWVSGAFGVNFKPDATFVPGAADVVVVPGGGWVARDEIGAWAEVRRGDWLPLLAEAARDGSVMAGVCTGAMLLAHAGVIGTRRATTHHDAQGDLADEGSVVTSGGVTSGIDLGLWLVSRYFGESLAEVVADGLEYPWTRLHGGAPSPA
jgi:transcriptional regulator GlxA family with amidase domain